MTKLETVELKFHNNSDSFPGYNHGMEFRPLKITDARLLAPVFKQHAGSIRTYLSTYQHADRWFLKDTQKFVSSCVNDPWPRHHYLFLIGKDPVGIASFYEYGSNSKEIQVVIAVFGSHQGRGIGKQMAVTLRALAMDVWGFEKLWWIVDATNRPSIALAQHIGCVFDSAWEDHVKHAENESGLWFAFRLDRDPASPPGVLQGSPLAYWNMPKTKGMLEAIIEAGGGTEALDRTDWSPEAIKAFDLENGLDY
jgi:RimJ/RimL family protein N-acetyltransferase